MIENLYNTEQELREAIGNYSIERMSSQKEDLIEKITNRLSSFGLQELALIDRYCRDIDSTKMIVMSEVTSLLDKGIFEKAEE